MIWQRIRGGQRTVIGGLTFYAMPIRRGLWCVTMYDGDRVHVVNDRASVPEHAVSAYLADLQ